MKKINEETVEQVCEGMTKSNGGTVVKIAAGVLSIAAGVGAVLFYKKKQNNKLETEDVENISEEIDEK